MFEINEEKFQGKFFGEVKELRYPTGEEVENTQEMLMNAEKGKELKAFRDLFLALGLDEETIKKLQVVHYQKLFEAILQKKS